MPDKEKGIKSKNGLLKVGDYVKVIFDNYVETYDSKNEAWVTLDGEQRFDDVTTPEEIEKYRSFIGKVGIVTRIDNVSITGDKSPLNISVKLSNNDEYGYDERELEKITEEAYYLYKFADA